MNERVSAIGNQIKQAFLKVREGWREQAPARKRLIAIIGAGLIVVALGLVIFLQTSAGTYTVLYAGLPREESVRGAGVLTDKGFVSRINDKGELEVPKNKADAAMGQLAIQGIPSSTLDYSILEKAGGLTTTDSEKKEYVKAQTEVRLQNIIKTFDDVENAYVTLNLGQNSNRVWDTEISKNSAAVKLNVMPGGKLTTGQVAGIRYTVGSGAGIDPANVSVIDDAGTVLAAAGDSNNMSTAGAEDFLQRLGFEEEVEKRLYDKTANILSLPYPDADDYRISATAKLDWDKMITESMEYTPLEGTDSGVANHEEIRAQMGTGQFTEGVVGETNNTDVPAYADLDGDGELDAVDYYKVRDYLVSYVKEQVEKDGVKLAEASVSVMVRGTLNNETRQTLREALAAATNLPIEKITVQGMLDSTTEEPAPGPGENTFMGIPLLFIYIAIGVLLLAIIALVIILILRSRAKKKRLAAEEAELLAEQEEAERIQQEIEERKQQLRNAALGDRSENIITDEVRDFAKNNPEITANLLRNWLREGES